MPDLTARATLSMGLDEDASLMWMEHLGVRLNLSAAFEAGDLGFVGPYRHTRVSLGIELQ